MNSLISKAVTTVAIMATVIPLIANDANVATLKKEFATVRTLELPARAASAVTRVKAESRTEAAADVVRAAVALNASSAPLVVGSISRADAASAPTAAATAVALQPKQVAQITRAAVAAAPAEAGAVVLALGKAQPVSYSAIALSAFDVAPKSGDAILNGLSASSAALKELITRAQKELVAAKFAPTVPAVMKRVETLVAALSKSSNKSTEVLLSGEFNADMSKQLTTLAVGGPTVGPPYTPYNPSGGEISTGNTGEAPPGGRIYSTP